MSRKIVFEASAFEDFNEWVSLDKKNYQKIINLIKDINRSPFSGLNMSYQYTGQDELMTNIA